jgi:hypothetical protein
VAVALRKSEFVNPDARVRCPTEDCWGDLVLFPAGQIDQDGIPSFQNMTQCPLCGQRFDLEPDIEDRDLYLKIAWLRENQYPGRRAGPPR